MKALFLLLFLLVSCGKSESGGNPVVSQADKGPLLENYLIGLPSGLTYIYFEGTSDYTVTIYYVSNFESKYFTVKGDYTNIDGEFKFNVVEDPCFAYEKQWTGYPDIYTVEQTPEQLGILDHTEECWTALF